MEEVVDFEELSSTTHDGEPEQIAPMMHASTQLSQGIRARRRRARIASAVIALTIAGGVVAKSIAQRRPAPQAPIPAATSAEAVSGPTK